MADAYTLPPLPYADDALAPTISAETISFHYGKHHKTYVDNLNKLVPGTDLEGKSLDELIAATVGNAAKVGVFNNAAQVAHHTFYWHSMKAGGGGAPTGKVAELINASFGSYDAFKAEFATKATTLFGSGWCWLTLVDGAVKIEQTKNADLPAGKALVVIDVWEHAYYVDFRNARAGYVAAWLDKLVNWDWANAQL
jgi:superoxide dismutase, Fe-Mn family